MKTTTIWAALAQVRALPWGEYIDRTAEGLRLCWAVAQLLAMAAAILWQVAYEHRQHIRSAAVTAAASAVVAAELTYRAGRWTRRELLALSDRSAHLVATQPLPVLAPITASLQAAREALELLIRRLYPVTA